VPARAAFVRRLAPRVLRRLQVGRCNEVCSQSGIIAGQSQVSQVGCERPEAAKLRVFFVTEADPLYVIRFFDVFFAEYPRHEFEICGITVDRAFHEPIWKTLRRMQAFFGPWNFFRQSMRFTQARLRGRSIEALARAIGVPIVPNWLGESAGIYRAGPNNGAGHHCLSGGAGNFQAPASHPAAARLHQRALRAAPDLSRHDAHVLANVGR
jgi:hypothetical protein